MGKPEAIVITPLPPGAPLPASTKFVGGLALVLGAGQFAMGLPLILMSGAKGSILAIPWVFITNVVCTALGGIIAAYGLALLLRREWGRKGMIVLLYVTAAMMAAVPVLLHFASFSRLQHLEVLRQADVTGSLNSVGPEFWAHLKRVSVLMMAAFAVMIVLFHTLLARYLGTPAVRAAFGEAAAPKQGVPPLPEDSPR